MRRASAATTRCMHRAARLKPSPTVRNYDEINRRATKLSDRVSSAARVHWVPAHPWRTVWSMCAAQFRHRARRYELGAATWPALRQLRSRDGLTQLRRGGSDRGWVLAPWCWLGGNGVVMRPALDGAIVLPTDRGSHRRGVDAATTRRPAQNVP